MAVPLDIAIIGGGLAGLAAAVSLRQNCSPQPRITIYESLDLGAERPSLSAQGNEYIHPTVGAGLALQENGVRVLRELDPRIGAAVQAGGQPCRGFEFRTAGGWLLGRSRMEVVAVARSVLVDALRGALPSDMIRRAKVTRTDARPGERPRIWIEGEADAVVFDMVVGADGVRSATRKALFGDDPKFHAEYSGQCAVGGIYSTASVPRSFAANPHIVFTMGRTGSMGYCPLSASTPDRILWWSVYPTAVPPGRGKELEIKELNRQIRMRHYNWGTPLLRRILSDAQSDNAWPIFTMPSLPHWGRDGVLLIGDAAHAMAPRTGQGSSQALEDAQTLGILVGECLARDRASNDDIVQSVIDGLYSIRNDRVRTIIARAERRKESTETLSVFQISFLYTVIFIMTKLETFSWIFKFFRNADVWDARTAVLEYLKRAK